MEEQSADAIETDGEPLKPEEHRVARRAFCEGIADIELDDQCSFDSLLERLDAAARPLLDEKRDQRSITNALNKMHGDWFEWLLCVIAQMVHCQENTRLVAIRLPNVSRFDSASLYEEELSSMIQSLRQEVRKANVELISSNPDFVLLNAALTDGVNHKYSPLSLDAVEWHEERYRSLIDRCAFDDIEGYLAAKYSFRPDRRLQIPHEGSLMKALYVHLQTRLWITRPKGLRFYAVSSKVGPADRKALQTVATHSITTVTGLPQAAVDAVFETRTIGDAKSMFRSILQ